MSSQAIEFAILVCLVSLCVGGGGYSIVSHLSNKKDGEYTVGNVVQLITGVMMMLGSFSCLAWILYTLGHNLKLL